MAAGLSEQSFVRLLERLDADRARAGDRYEELRRTLMRFFEWRGTPFPETHADDTFDRVARKLAEGVEIKNVGAYCYSVARLIALETRKAPDARRASPDALDHAAAVGHDEEAMRRERRLQCLETCLQSLPAEGRGLIVEYYRHDQRERIDARRAIAERLGVRVEALANRAQRLRDKLERCVRTCLERPQRHE